MMYILGKFTCKLFSLKVMEGPYKKTFLWRHHHLPKQKHTTEILTVSHLLEGYWKKNRGVFDILPLSEQLQRSSELMFSSIFQDSQLSVYVLCHHLTKAQFSCILLRKETVVPARIILQAHILNFPFLCYSWENKVFYYEEISFNFSFFLIIPFYHVQDTGTERAIEAHPLWIVLWKQSWANSRFSWLGNYQFLKSTTWIMPSSILLILRITENWTTLDS